MTAAEEAGEASLAVKGLFAAGLGVVAAGNVWTRYREQEDPALGEP